MVSFLFDDTGSDDQEDVVKMEAGSFKVAHEGKSEAVRKEKKNEHQS